MLSTFRCKTYITGLVKVTAYLSLGLLDSIKQRFSHLLLCQVWTVVLKNINMFKPDLQWSLFLFFPPRFVCWFCKCRADALLECLKFENVWNSAYECRMRRGYLKNWYTVQQKSYDCYLIPWFGFWLFLL